MPHQKEAIDLSIKWRCTDCGKESTRDRAFYEEEHAICNMIPEVVDSNPETGLSLADKDALIETKKHH